ncbi:MAG: monofunctional biosynthetic peptidoglycan transglycosylase [Lysobacterales bacterium]
MSRSSKKPARSLWSRLRRLSLWLLAVFVGGSLLLVLLLRWLPPPTSAFMLARHWQARGAGQSGFVLQQSWRPLSRISAHLPLAVVAAEDQRFPEHHGFDLTEIGKAMQQAGKRPRGASTLTQQLAKNLFLWSGRSYLRKGLEAWFTLLIEATWPKRRIIEVYLNVVEFGDGIYGAEAAAQHFFRRSAASLGADQAARLAAVLPNPKYYHADRPGPYLIQRQAFILRQMRQLGGTAWVADWTQPN